MYWSTEAVKAELAYRQEQAVIRRRRRINFWPLARRHRPRTETITSV